MKRTIGGRLIAGMAIAVLMALMATQVTLPALAMKGTTSASAPFSADGGRIRVVLDNLTPRAAKAKIIILITMGNLTVTAPTSKNWRPAKWRFRLVATPFSTSSLTSATAATAC